MWLPDAITEDIFTVDARYSPIKIGIEQDGLNEFLMQPLRAAMVQRGRLLPIEPLKAPKGKLDFIKSLQPFFKSGEIIFAGVSRDSFQDMIDQLMSFPTGRIDAPNALAYLLTMRPGIPVYEDFSEANVSPSVAILSRTPLFLCLNSGSGVTSAILCELINSQLVIHADWVREGDPGATLPGIFLEVRALAPRNPTVFAPREHFTYSSSGMKSAMRVEAMELRRGGEFEDGREVIRTMLGRSIRGLPTLRVTPGAEWCLRAFSGGYARKFGTDDPIPGVYQVLAEGLESWAATLRGGQQDDSIRYSFAGGRRFISARAAPKEEYEQNQEKINRVLADG
jgi:hypothetical protein